MHILWIKIAAKQTFIFILIVDLKKKNEQINEKEVKNNNQDNKTIMLSNENVL